MAIFVVRIPQGPHSHILMTGGGEGGGIRVIFLALKFWPKKIFWVYERGWGFFGSQKKGLFWVVKKGLKDFFGYAKKVVFFLGRQILKL